MTLKTNFCSSPWIHMRITNSGNYEFCRWSDQHTNINIRNHTPLEFFQTHMAPVRAAMLHGESVPACKDCQHMEQHHKVSGRQRQLLKTGVVLDNFEKTLRSSTYWSAFEKSNASAGVTDLSPVDWQIDLGNYCNSGCVYCAPESSSRLAQEFKKLKISQAEPAVNWATDTALIDRFVDSLASTDQLAYLHFLGGETLITPAFKTVLEKLIAANINHRVSIGFTTNLTVWDNSIVELLTQFDQVHLGMSMECFHAVNDYVRWPSNIKSVEQILLRWIALGRQRSWYMSLRTTPTALTIPYLITVYEFASKHNINIESCNFLHNPKFLRMSVLPMQYRHGIADQIQAWVDQQGVPTSTQLINTRDPNQQHLQITQDAVSYVDYLRTATDDSHLLPELVAYLKLLESSRANSILDCKPEYEHILRSAGY
jgi:sulfatase maturation enzyme AslB (radical SAM superfamily)